MDVRGFEFTHKHSPSGSTPTHDIKFLNRKLIRFDNTLTTDGPAYIRAVSGSLALTQTLGNSSTKKNCLLLYIYPLYTVRSAASQTGQTHARGSVT